MSAPDGLPNLLVIGAQKCGTSSLHRYLDLHPQIGMSRVKELDFFLEHRTWSRGAEWYADQFARSMPVRGESSPNYTDLPLSEGVAARMAGVVSDARLVYMVRDPIERALSHWIHARGLEREDRSADEALADPDSRYVRRSLYRTQLEPFVERFQRRQILIAEQADLLERRADTLRELFGWLDVDPSFISPEFEREWEVSAGKGRKFSLAYRASRLVGGKDFWGRVPARVRWRLERIAYGRIGDPVEPPRLSDPVRERLIERLRPEVDWLREYSGRDFAAWSV